MIASIFPAFTPKMMSSRISAKSASPEDCQNRFLQTAFRHSYEPLQIVEKNGNLSLRLLKAEFCRTQLERPATMAFSTAFRMTLLEQVAPLTASTAVV